MEKYEYEFGYIEESSVKICPYDCQVCNRPECRDVGCERTGENMMGSCEECGMLVLAVRYSPFCLTCINRES